MKKVNTESNSDKGNHFESKGLVIMGICTLEQNCTRVCVLLFFSLMLVFVVHVFVFHNVDDLLRFQ